MVVGIGVFILIGAFSVAGVVGLPSGHTLGAMQATGDFRRHCVAGLTGDAFVKFMGPYPYSCGNFDIIWDQTPRVSQLHASCHAPCTMLYFVPMLIGC